MVRLSGPLNTRTALRRRSPPIPSGSVECQMERLVNALTVRRKPREAVVDGSPSVQLDGSPVVISALRAIGVAGIHPIDGPPIRIGQAPGPPVDMPKAVAGTPESPEEVRTVARDVDRSGPNLELSAV